MIAIIPARGGSKRIPHKNIKSFVGRPILSYSIKAALESNLFDVVMVSTDSEEIADIAVQEGADVPFLRSRRNSDDFATTSDVLEEVVMEYEKMGVEFDCFCCIYPTAPFVTADKLKKAYNILCKEDAEGVFSIVKYSYPPQRCIVVRDGLASFQNIEYRYTRSQDLESIYHDAGQFYFLRKSAFLQQHDLVLKKTVPFIVDELEVQDIDNGSNWKIAEMKYKLMVENDG